MLGTRASAIRHFKIEESLSLRHWWRHQDLSETELENLLALGAIFKNGARLGDPGVDSTSLQRDDILRVHFEPRRYFWRPDLAPEWILSETEDTLLVRKPAGLPTHPTLDNIKENLLHHLHVSGHPEALMVHRLDIGTDGLILFARHREAQKSLAHQFEAREVTKVYSALTRRWPRPPPRLEHWMKNSERAPKELFTEPAIDRKLCRLYITEATDIGPDHSALEIKLETGRTHQIRSQLGKTGHPILGDRMYGSREPWFAPLASEHHLEAWALRCQRLTWEEADSIQHFEIEPLGAAALAARPPLT